MGMLFTSKLSDYIQGNRISTATDGGGSTQQRWGCLKSWLLFRHPRGFKIKSLYNNDLILNIASKSKDGGDITFFTAYFRVPVPKS